MAGIASNTAAAVIVGAIILSWPILIIITLTVLRLFLPPPLPDLPFSIPSSNLAEGNPAFFHIHSAVANTNTLPQTIPGIRSRFHLDFASKNSRHFSVDIPSNPSIPVSSGPLARGEYQLERYGYRFTDTLNSASLFIYAKDVLTASLSVHPRSFDMGKTLLELHGGEANPGGSLTRFGNDLSDQRKYVPGDDPRKINWKLYGHTEELFLRIREKEPPPKGQLYLYLDTFVDKTLFKNANDTLDCLARAALHLCREALSASIEILLLTPGAPILSIHDENVEAILASLLPTPSPYPFTVPQEGTRQGLYLALPSSQGLEAHTLGLFAKQANSISAFIIQAAPNPKRPPITLKNFMLIVPPDATKTVRPNPRIAAACQKTLHACLQQGVSSARIIP
jgi:uncharacterized protein (DUF58 family)